MVPVIATQSGVFVKQDGWTKPPLWSPVFGTLWLRYGALGTTMLSSWICCGPQRRIPATMEGARSPQTTSTRIAVPPMLLPVALRLHPPLQLLAPEQASLVAALEWLVGLSFPESGPGIVRTLVLHRSAGA